MKAMGTAACCDHDGGPSALPLPQHFALMSSEKFTLKSFALHPRLGGEETMTVRLS